MTHADLGGPLLASVSRSFYLTIRILPRALRGPIGLAYLLARASDTIADTADAPPAVREKYLADFAAMIARDTRENLAALQRDLRPTAPGEVQLIASLDRCLDWLAALPEADRREIRAVMPEIIRGQTLDLQRFAEAGAITALATATELDEYTYLVAGSVGAFWTRICLHHLPRYATLDAAALTRLGINYGKGLQLVNILRDAPADLRDGRCYLPADELLAAGIPPASLPAAPAAAQPVFDRWTRVARQHLRDGFTYLRSLRPARLRVGVFLPWYLGEETLHLLAERPPLLTAERVKVPRRTVRRALWRALPVAFSNTALDRLATSAGRNSAASR